MWQTHFWLGNDFQQQMADKPIRYRRRRCRRHGHDGHDCVSSLVMHNSSPRLQPRHCHWSRYPHTYPAYIQWKLPPGRFCCGLGHELNANCKPISVQGFCLQWESNSRALAKGFERLKFSQLLSIQYDNELYCVQKWSGSPNSNSQNTWLEFNITLTQATLITIPFKPRIQKQKTQTVS